MKIRRSNRPAHSPTCWIFVVFLVGLALVVDRVVFQDATSLELSESLVSKLPSEKNRLAIVYKVKGISDDSSVSLCELQRFQALVEGTNDLPYDLILLHEPEEAIAPSLQQWIQDSGEISRVHVQANPIVPRVKQVTGERTRKWKLSFLLWAVEFEEKTTQKYDFYWVVEDDVYWTGRWGDFFQAVDQRVGTQVGVSPDYVRKANLHHKDHWDWQKASFCRIHGHVCWNTTTETIFQGYNNLVRFSYPYVRYLVDLLQEDALRGVDEATFPAAVEIWRTEQANHGTMSQHQHHHHHHQVDLFAGSVADFEGINELGGWSIWDVNVKEAFSLRGLANLYQQASIDFDKVRETSQIVRQGLQDVYPSNLEVPGNKVFHPVKCFADPSMGEAALTFAQKKKH